MSNERSVRITVLMENTAGDQPLRFEHGLSLWIEAHCARLLFDTGRSNAFVENARHLGTPLEETDFIVLSHGHYDHTGGLAAALRNAPQACLVLHPGAVMPRYSIPPGRRARPVGMPRTSLAAVQQARDGKTMWAVRPVGLVPGIGATGPIPRETDYEDVGGPFFLDPEGRRPDPIEDDVAMWINTSEGAIVCVGCSHAGLVNTLSHVRRLTGGVRIRAVIGGFHLLEAKPQRMDKTVAALRYIRPALLAPCHCTGEAATRTLRDALGDVVSRVHSGMVFQF